MVAIRVADVVEMNSVHVVIANDFQQRIHLQLLVLGVGGAEPGLLLPGRASLQPVLPAQLIHKFLGRSSPQVPVHFPNVDLETMLATGRQTLADLITPRGHLSFHRQNLAAAKADSAPEHVGEDSGESIIGQASCRFVPGHAGHPEGTVTPKGAELAGQRLVAPGKTLL